MCQRFLVLQNLLFFGVNLKYRFPFFCALIGSASAAAIAGLLQVVAVSLGSAGFLGFLSIKASSIPFYVVCELISFAIAFAVTYGYGKTKAVDVFAAEAAVEEAIEEVQEIPEEAASAANKAQVTDEVLAAPLAGEAVELTSVNDPVFPSEAMGKGLLSNLVVIQFMHRLMGLFKLLLILAMLMVLSQTMVRRFLFILVLIQYQWKVKDLNKKFKQIKKLKR